MLLLLALLVRQESAPPAPGGELSGEVTLGLRFLGVDGDRGQFEEDRNLDGGPFLRAFVLEGSPAAGTSPIDRFALRASGIGDPQTQLSLETVGGPWRTGARFARSRFVGNAQDDLHPFDLRRDRGTLELQYAPAGGASRAALELGYHGRDGIALESRALGFSFVQGFPARREEQELSAEGRWSTAFGGTGLELALGVEGTRSRDRYDYTLASALFPGDPVSEDFAADVDGRGLHGELRLDREFDGGRIRVDGGLEWQDVERRGNLETHEASYSFFPGLPFLRDTQGDLDFDQEELAGDLGATFRLGADADIELRYTRSREEEAGSLLEVVILDELQGDPPSVTTSPSSLDRDRRSDLFELGLSSALGPAVVLDVDLEWTHERLFTREVVEGTTTRFFDGDLDEVGAQGSLSVDLTRTLTAGLSGGRVRRPTESSAIGVEYDFGDERTTFAELEGRWRPAPATTLSARTRYEGLESDAFDANGTVLRHALAVASRGPAGWTWNGTLAYRTWDREARVNDLFFDPMTGTTSVPGLATFDGIERSASASTAWEITPEFAPRLAATAALAGGDASFDAWSGALILPWNVEKGLEVGAELLYLDFEGQGVLADATYDALVLTLYVRKGF